MTSKTNEVFMSPEIVTSLQNFQINQIKAALYKEYKAPYLASCNERITDKINELKAKNTSFDKLMTGIVQSCSEQALLPMHLKDQAETFIADSALTNTLTQITDTLVTLSQQATIQSLQTIEKVFDSSKLVKVSALILDIAIQIAVQMVLTPFASYLCGILTRELKTTGPSAFGLIPTRTTDDSGKVSTTWDVQFHPKQLIEDGFEDHVYQAFRESVTSYATGIIGKMVSTAEAEARKKLVPAGATDSHSIASPSIKVNQKIIEEVIIPQSPDAKAFDDANIEETIYKIVILDRIANTNININDLSAPQGAQIVKEYFDQCLAPVKMVQNTHKLEVEQYLSTRLSAISTGAKASEIAFQAILTWHEWRIKHTWSTQVKYMDKTWEALTNITVNGHSLVKKSGRSSEILDNHDNAKDMVLKSLKSDVLGNKKELIKTVFSKQWSNSKNDDQNIECIVSKYMSRLWRANTPEIIRKTKTFQSNSAKNSRGSLLVAMHNLATSVHQERTEATTLQNIYKASYSSFTNAVCARLAPQNEGGVWFVQYLDEPTSNESEGIQVNQIHPMTFNQKISSN